MSTTWIAIDEGAGVWAREYHVPGMKSRTVAVRLPSDRFLVYSPGKTVATSFAETVGAAELLLAPNSYHHLGIRNWKQRFPSAQTVAAPAAHARLASKGHSGLLSPSSIADELGEKIAIWAPPGTRIGEAWLRIESTRGVIWVIGDSFFNMPRLARRFVPRWIQRLTKAAPGLSMSQLMKWGGLSDRRLFKNWVLDKLTNEPPHILVPVHGEVLDDSDLVPSLRALIDVRL